VHNDLITIVLIDHGESFDPSEIPLPDLKADLSDRKIGGLGIFLMRKLMDEVHYEAKPNKSNVLTMSKRKSVAWRPVHGLPFIGLARDATWRRSSMLISG
jgi:anti-sigma regulatory factor (Ser/Thr protein kinase)